MLKGIDISNWQSDISIASLTGIDFIIAKATESTWYIDPCCDKFIQAAKKKKLLWGFYHFNGKDNPENEAKFFYDNCKGYINEGIPILDYETVNPDNVAWVETFVTEFHRLSGIWPMIYMSEFAPIGIKTFSSSWVPEKCGLWCANYNRDYDSWPDISDCPVNPFPWPFVAMWQFASDWHLKSYMGNLDANIAFMNKAAWAKYAGSMSDKQDNKKEDNSKTPNESGKILTGRVTIELD